MKKQFIVLALSFPLLLNAQQHDMNNMPAKDIQVKTKQKIKSNAESKTVRYDLYVRDTVVNFTGKEKHGIAINGSIPAPTLYFTEGDTAEIYVHNNLSSETSTHWHGLILPNEFDGVPYQTTQPIVGGRTHLFKFPIVQNGTYWYHSHSMQEQMGMYGAIVIYPNDKPIQKEKVVLFSDWTDESMNRVFRSLKANYEWYGIKRKSVQSWGEATIKGYLVDKVKQEWSRMPSMDVSDVYYNAYLANGKRVTEYPEYKAGETIKLRLINGGAGSYIIVQFAGGSMTIVAADGKDVEPIKVDKIDFPIAETYDVLITIPADGSYELRATSADISGYSSVYFGKGKKINSPTIPKNNYFAMLHEMNKMDMGSMNKKHSMSGMDMNHQKEATEKMKTNEGEEKMKHPMPEHEGMKGMKMDKEENNGTLTYDMLRSVEPTAFGKDLPVREIQLTLTGNMIRYKWSFDYIPLSKADKILIKKGEVVRFKFYNNTMMRHPMHLHGHFFRVINSQGDYSPLKHTFDIKPMESVTIEFLANADQDWFFHCHILYHMATGMGRIVSYEGSEQNEFAKTGYAVLKKGDNATFKWADLNVLSNGVWGDGTISNNKTQLRFEGRASWKGDYETETHLVRYLDKRDFLAGFIGYDNRYNKGGLENTSDNRKVFEAGLIYLLPFFIEAEVRIDQTGRFRAQLERKDMPITTRLFFDGRVNTDREYTVGLRYFLTRTFSINGLYDNDYGVGAGIGIRY